MSQPQSIRDSKAVEEFASTNEPEEGPLSVFGELPRGAGGAEPSRSYESKPDRCLPISAAGRSRVLLFFFLLTLQPLAAQDTGTITGVVTDNRGRAVHHATILVIQTGHTVDSDHEGNYRIEGLPPGLYDLFAQVAGLSSPARLVEVTAGETKTVNLSLELSPLQESVTVTARGKHQTTFEAVQSVSALETFDIAENMATSVGEVLEGQPGMAKRSFGPGSARPVIRGFDGDRVLVLNDGMRTGSLGSQSGDHAEPIDPGNLERLEVVKGPATLLYGSNAIGGVVNAISRHHEMHKHRHEGTRGQITSGLGSNNGLAGLNSSVEYGAGDWMFWGGGGGQRAGDYSSPEGTVEDSKSRVTNGKFGAGWYGSSFYLSGGYALQDGRFGIPYATEFGAHDEDGHEAEGLEERELEAVDVDWRSQTLRFDAGVPELNSILSNIRASLSYTRWTHDELEILSEGVEETGTEFENRQLTFRGDFDHDSGPFSGTLGIWGTNRDYQAIGEEALSPPVDQDGIAFFALEEFGRERLKFQLGGRLEHTRYAPKGFVERPSGAEGPEGTAQPAERTIVELPDRSFTGLSGSAGIRAGLWREGAFVAHFTTSYRAPSLEELYNFGPHVGNLAFEIGNSDLKGERSNGFELSLRHSGSRLAAEANFFLYSIEDYIFGAPTGEIEEGLLVLASKQGDSRFVGSELQLDLGLTDSIWIDTGLDFVDARLTSTDTPLPRIPPLRTRVGLSLRKGGISLEPRLVMASRQDEIFPTETETAGYTVANLAASYTLPRQHFVHHFAFEIFNLSDRLYRNHVSFIKELAPEIGRGVRVSYAMKFF